MPKVSIFTRAYVEEVSPPPRVEIWKPGEAGAAQRQALGEFLDQFTQAGALIPALFPTSKSPYFKLSGHHRYGHIDVGELLCDTQVLVAKYIHEHVPGLFRALRKLGDAEKGPHALLFDDLPTAAEHVESPSSIYMHMSQRPGMASDYLTAAASLIMGGRTGQVISFHDVVDKKQSRGRLIHNDPPEQFFILHCQRTDSSEEKAYTMLHDMEKAFRRLNPEEQALLQEKIFKGKHGQLFAPVSVSEDGRFSLSATKDIRHNLEAEGEKKAEAVAVIHKWMEFAVMPENSYAVSLQPGQALVVDARYMLHSVARIGKSAQVSEEEGLSDRWLIRSGIYARSVYAEKESGALYRMPKDISLEETLKNIGLVTRALEAHRESTSR